MAVDQNNEQVDPQVPESYEHLLEDYSHFAPPSADEVVQGTVLSITAKDVIIDFGYKSEGLVPIEQFQSPTGEVTVQRGDVVDVMIDRSEQVEVIGEGVMTVNGHCTYLRSGRCILNDTYPDKARLQHP